jgi:hypothetical protein
MRQRREAVSEDRINLETLGVRVATLTDQVDDPKLKVADLKIRFTTFEARFSALESRFARFEQRFSIQEDRISRILAISVRIAERQGLSGADDGTARYAR